MPTYRVSFKMDVYMDAIIDAADQEALLKMFDESGLRNFNIELDFTDYDTASIDSITILEEDP